MTLADGDFVDLDWLRAGRGRLAVLSHGLEGNARAGYIRGMARALRGAGWDVLAWNYRGCGGVANALPRSYHSGESGDLREMIARVAADYDDLALVGFSLGGNITLKYLGEAPPHPKVRAGVAISTPVDLASSARALDQRPGNRIYLQRFLKSLTAKVEAKALQFPGQFAVERLQQVRGFQDFDDWFTAPMHGFRDAEDYWARSSARAYLPGITVPALLLNARNDPFLTEASFPEQEARRSAWFHLEAPASGGHVGFVDFRKGLTTWAERRTLAFLEPVGRSVHA